MPLHRAVTHATRIGGRQVLNTAGEVAKALWPLILPILEKKITEWIETQESRPPKKRTKAIKKKAPRIKAPAKKVVKKAVAKRVPAKKK